MISWVLLALEVGYDLKPFLTESKSVSAATADAVSDLHYAGCIKTLFCRHSPRAWLSSERIFSGRE